MVSVAVPAQSRLEPKIPPLEAPLLAVLTARLAAFEARVDGVEKRLALASQTKNVMVRSVMFVMGNRDVVSPAAIMQELSAAHAVYTQARIVAINVSASVGLLQSAVCMHYLASTY